MHERAGKTNDDAVVQAMRDCAQALQQWWETREGNDEAEAAPKELIKMAVDTPRRLLGGGPRREALAGVDIETESACTGRHIRLRRMKLGKKNRAKMQRVVRGPEPAQVETVVKVEGSGARKASARGKKKRLGSA